MRFEIRVPNLPGAGALSEYARERLLSTLGHELRAIDALVVSLIGLRRHGAPAMRCRVIACLSPWIQLAVEEIDASPHDAIDRASERLAVVMSRKPLREDAHGAGEPADAPVPRHPASSTSLGRPDDRVHGIPWP